MRKLLSALILFSSLCCLYSTAFKSNELAQKLERIDRLSADGYVLVEESDFRKLYLDGKIVWEEVMHHVSEDEYSIVRKYADSDMMQIFEYKDGRLVHEATSGSGSENHTYFAYNDGKLVLTTTRIDDEGTSTVSFLRTSADGQVVGVSDNGEIRFLSDDYVYQNGSVIQTVTSGLVVSGEHTVLEDGTILVKENGSDLYYSSDGRILKSVTIESTTIYNYQDNRLLSVETTSGNRRIVENYKDNRAFEQYVYINEELESHTVYNEEGNVTTLYSNGRQIAIVHYKKDNRTVDRIEYN